MQKPKIEKRRVTKRQWNKYVPVKTLSSNLRKVASALDELPKDVRGKILLQIEIGKPV